VFYLVYAAQLALETLNFCYLHSILLSIIFLLIVDPAAARQMNEPCQREFGCRFKPTSRFHGDLVLDVLLNLWKHERFWPSIACILHTLAPHLERASTTTAMKVLGLFERIVGSHSNVVSIFVEAFASIVQRKQSPENGFLVAIYHKADVFEKIPKTRGIDVVMMFLKSAKTLVRATRKLVPEIGNEQLALLLAELDLTDLIQPMTFARRSHFIGDEIEKTWADWADILFVKAFRGEIKQLELLQRGS
jgi:hypothetical protein